MAVFGALSVTTRPSTRSREKTQLLAGRVNTMWDSDEAWTQHPWACVHAVLAITHSSSVN